MTFLFLKICMSFPIVNVNNCSSNSNGLNLKSSMITLVESSDE
jgi:hypothetical protein